MYLLAIMARWTLVEAGRETRFFWREFWCRKADSDQRQERGRLRSFDTMIAVVNESNPNRKRHFPVNSSATLRANFRAMWGDVRRCRRIRSSIPFPRHSPPGDASEMERAMGIKNTAGAHCPLGIMKLQARRAMRAIFV
jgi:hypothetical protein